jgi:hypothetical protein
MNGLCLRTWRRAVRETSSHLSPDSIKLAGPHFTRRPDYRDPELLGDLCRPEIYVVRETVSCPPRVAEFAGVTEVV